MLDLMVEHMQQVLVLSVSIAFDVIAIWDMHDKVDIVFIARIACVDHIVEIGDIDCIANIGRIVMDTEGIDYNNCVFLANSDMDLYRPVEFNKVPQNQLELVKFYIHCLNCIKKEQLCWQEGYETYLYRVLKLFDWISEEHKDYFLELEAIYSSYDKVRIVDDMSHCRHSAEEDNKVLDMAMKLLDDPMGFLSNHCKCLLPILEEIHAATLISQTQQKLY